MLELHVGNPDIKLPAGGFLYLHDEPPSDFKGRIFDPRHDGFNPLKELDEEGAEDLVAALYTISAEGANTLTVRNGRRSLLEALISQPAPDKSKKKGTWGKLSNHRRKELRFDEVRGDEEVTGMVQDILGTSLRRRVLCTPSDFSFNPKFKIAVRLNRAELKERTCLILGLLLMSYYKGLFIIPDFGFYGRDIHTSLIRENRLIAGVNDLSELPDKLRRRVLSIRDKTGRGALYEDAVTLAEYAGLVPDPTREHNPYNDFIKDAMA
jgi:hypothetical protein